MPVSLLMRELLLVRHGQAESTAFGGDAARMLTDDGKAGIAAVGRGLAALGLRPDAIWHSPLLRAFETATLLAHALALGDEAVRREPLLEPGTSPERTARAIVDAGTRCLLCVSHLPLLPQLAGVLTGARLDFGTGTVAHLAQVGPNGAALVGLWSAQLLARLR